MKPVLWWLLEQYCRDNGIDIQECDKSLTYGENLDLLTRKFGRLETPRVYATMRRSLKR